jgi:hypothetical protein
MGALDNRRHRSMRGRLRRVLDVSSPSLSETLEKSYAASGPRAVGTMFTASSLLPASSKSLILSRASVLNHKFAELI